MSSSSIGTWLDHGSAAEADWGAYVTRLALRGELGSGGDGLLLDVPALAQPFACVSASCTPGIRAPRTRSCCADLDVELAPEERAAITDALPEIAEWMGARDPRWRDGAPEVFDGETLLRPGKRCVFATPGGSGLRCGLHGIEDATGRPRGTLKPMPCRLFPLIVVDLGEERLLLSAVARHTARHVGLPSPGSFPCLRGDTTESVPLVVSVRETIVELWGEDVFRAARRAVTAWRRGAAG